MEVISKRNLNRTIPKVKDESTILIVDITKIIELITTEISNTPERTGNIIENIGTITQAGHTITTTNTAITNLTTRKEPGITRIRTAITKKKTKNITRNIRVRKGGKKERVVIHLWNQLRKKGSQLRKQSMSAKIDNV